MNFNKYKNIIFHTNSSINKKIEALFLLYDKQCEEKKLSYKDRIYLINYFIKTLSNNEEYELAKAFKDRKIRKYRKYRDARRDNLPTYIRLMRKKVTKFFRNLFKRK